MKTPAPLVPALAALLALGACALFEPGTDAEAPPDANGPDAAQDAAAAPLPGEALAPEFFELTARGLWDGRPAFGGVWVAHPDVTAPERVLIRNTENGAEVTGALYRRERETPGPPVQVAPETAAALEMLPGQPALLEITALRRPEQAEPDDPEAEPDAAP